MTHYAVVGLNIKDDGWVEGYLPNVTALVEKHGGKYIVRTPDVELVEGEGPKPDIFVIIEWSTKEGAQAFYNDPDYQPYRQSRLAGSSGNFFLVAGEDIAAS